MTNAQKQLAAASIMGGLQKMIGEQAAQIADKHVGSRQEYPHEWKAEYELSVQQIKVEIKSLLHRAVDKYQG